MKKAFPSILIVLAISLELSAQFSYNGSSWYNNSGQKFGFGTNNPQELIHLNGNIRGNQSGALRINSGFGWVDIGSKNTSWAHFNTDRARYYFDKEIRVNSGYIGSYDENLYLRTSGSTRMTIQNSTGNIGIGTTSPVSWAALDIKKSGSSYIRLMGTNESGNYSGINFTSDESIDKEWEIIHRSGHWGAAQQNVLLFAYNDGANWSNPLIIKPNGNIGIGVDFDQINSKLDVGGTTTTEILEITGGSDLAESFKINSDYELLPGMVVSIDPENPGKLMLATSEYDKKVAGIISGANQINTGLLLNQKGTITDGDYPVALTGRVYCYVDASNSEIEPGDFLTTSSMPGYAMEATNFEKAQGAIIGKAMTPLKVGEKGLVLVLVSLK